MFRLRLSSVVISLMLVVPGLASGETTPSAVKKEDLRYDGKPFAYWRTYLLTELKAERRMEAISAMAAFGARGYAGPAAQTLLEVVKEFSLDQIIFIREPETSDQKTISTIFRAMAKICPEATPVLLKALDDPKVRTLTLTILTPNNYFSFSSIPPAAVPVLVGKLGAKDMEVRDAVAKILVPSLIFPDIEKAFRKEITIPGKAHAMALGLKDLDPNDYTVTLLSFLGPKARPALPLLLKASLLSPLPSGYVFAGGNTQVIAEKAQQTLLEINPSPAEEVPILIELLKKEPDYEVAAAKKLAQMGKPAHAAIPVLLKNLNKPLAQDAADHKARIAQIDALEKLGADPKVLVAAIRIFLTGQYPRQDLLVRFLKLEKDADKRVAEMEIELDRLLEIHGKGWSPDGLSFLKTIFTPLAKEKQQGCNRRSGGGQA